MVQVNSKDAGCRRRERRRAEDRLSARRRFFVGAHLRKLMMAVPIRTWDAIMAWIRGEKRRVAFFSACTDGCGQGLSDGAERRWTSVPGVL
jgi:hypothetical protein